MFRDVYDTCVLYYIYVIYNIYRTWLRDCLKISIYVCCTDSCRVPLCRFSICLFRINRFIKILIIPIPIIQIAIKWIHIIVITLRQNYYFTSLLRLILYIVRGRTIATNNTNKSTHITKTNKRIASVWDSAVSAICYSCCCRKIKNSLRKTKSL